MATRHVPLIAGLVGAILAGSVLAGCAHGAPGPAASATSGGSVSASTPGSASAGPPGTAPPSATASGRGGEMTVTGMVEPGVEAGCLLLRTDTQAYLLVGGDRSVMSSGARLTVRGYPNPQLMGFCMQGEPFEVIEAHPA